MRTNHHLETLFWNSANFRTVEKTDGIGLFTGQIGYAWNATLVYVKGGAAVTSNRFDILTTAGDVDLASASSTRWGGTVGVGFEYGFAPNWSAGLEYDHLFMGNRDISSPTGFLIADHVKEDVDLFTVRLNYKFGGPVVARY